MFLLLATASGFVAALYLLKEVLQTLSIAWTSGLSCVPAAHWTAPYSQAWILYQRGSKNEHSARRAAHERLGPVIRLGPKEISINCVEGGLRTVYGGNWDKSGFYAAFENYGHHPLFSISEGKKHAARKRMLAHVYAKTYIDNSPDVAKLLAVVNSHRLIPLLEESASTHEPVDILFLAERYFMDAVTAYLYGLQNSTNLLQNPVEASTLLSAFETSLGPDTFFLLNFPRLTGLLARIGWHLVPEKVYHCFPVYLGFGRKLHDATKTDSLALSEEKDAHPSDQVTSAAVVWTHFRQALLSAAAKPEERQDSLKDAERAPADPELDNIIAAEMLDHLHAAHLASGILITYVLWELSCRPKVQAALISELKQSRARGEDLTRSSSSLENSLLERILIETMRLHPPAFGPFPRVVPLEGATLGAGKIGNGTIPGGTVVSASPYTLGRNPDVFDCPNEWDPSRWQVEVQSSDDKGEIGVTTAAKANGDGRDDSGDGSSASGRDIIATQSPTASTIRKTKLSAERRREMQKWVWGFGSGARMCIGKHFAELTMKSMLVSIYERFSTELAATADGTDTDMRHVEAMMAAPKGGKLMMSFCELAQ